MQIFDSAADLEAHIGQAIGVGDWLSIDQERIDRFAEATGDRQWIHTDPDRAARELPGGKTIAHGWLLLSLLPLLAASAFQIRNRSRTVNYGSNKVRFVTPVPVNSRVRLHVTMKSVEVVEGGRRLTYENTLELEGASRPAMIAETISIAYD